MTRSILCGLLTLISVGALAVVPIACQSGGVGDPCTPEDEYNTQFPGFKVQEENIESRSFQCSTRICLVNHFQGRVSCPLGQSLNDIHACSGPMDGSCGAGATCVESQTLAPECTCDPHKMGDCDAACSGIQGTTCDPTLKVCGCKQSQTVNGIPFSCALADPACKGMTCLSVLKSYLCHPKDHCQSATATDADNAGKQCCIPGTNTPVGVTVCGQCETTSHRNAADAVYCSCRCCPKCCDDPGLAMGEACEKDKTLCGTACDPNFNYCKCPTGFACSEIRKNVGLGDAQLTGSYCIKENSAYTGNASSCGTVKGNADLNNCAGLGASNAGDGGIHGDGG